MLILRGSPALSSFRLQKLLDGLVAAGLPARAVGAEFVHVVETSADLTPAAASPSSINSSPTARAAPPPPSPACVQVVAPAPRHHFAVVVRKPPTSPTSAASRPSCASSASSPTPSISAAGRCDSLSRYLDTAQLPDAPRQAPRPHDAKRSSATSRPAPRSSATSAAPDEQRSRSSPPAAPPSSSPTQYLGLALADDEIDYLVDAFTTPRPRPAPTSS